MVEVGLVDRGAVRARENVAVGIGVGRLALVRYGGAGAPRPYLDRAALPRNFNFNLTCL